MLLLDIMISPTTQVYVMANCLVGAASVTHLTRPFSTLFQTVPPSPLRGGKSLWTSDGSEWRVKDLVKFLSLENISSLMHPYTNKM